VDSLLPALRPTSTNHGKGFAVMEWMTLADCRVPKSHELRRPKTARVQEDERRPRRPKTTRTMNETKRKKKTSNEAQECMHQTKQQGVQASTNTKQRKQRQRWLCTQRSSHHCHGAGTRCLFVVKASSTLIITNIVEPCDCQHQHQSRDWKGMEFSTV